VETIIEKPVYEDLISAGIYVINPEALTYIKENTFTDMPNLLMTIAQDGHKISTYSLQEEWIDIGRHDDLERARKIFVEKINNG
jgi:NDP-sugar pyrophosphorylase family protein